MRRSLSVSEFSGLSEGMSSSLFLFLFGKVYKLLCSFYFVKYCD